MKIASYLLGGVRRFGMVVEESLFDLPNVTTLADIGGDGAWAQRGAEHPLRDAKLLPPAWPLNRNPFCVGWNYAAHFEEGRGTRAASAPAALPDRPTFFTKATDSVVGPYDDVQAHPTVTQSLDWEVELAVVIGRSGRDIAERRALDHVLGYTIANDVSARDVQKHHGGQWFRGKSLDGTCPLGPWIVTTDELPDLAPLAIECRLDGELVQSATLGEMHFGVARIIAELSAGLTLHAGDVILTGTPPGVGNARDPQRFLAIGSTLESRIEGIGELRNQIVG